MKEIHGHEQTIKQLIGKKYVVDSYQREYKWESTQLNDLINDLSVSFNDNYKEEHEPGDKTCRKTLRRNGRLCSPIG